MSSKTVAVVVIVVLVLLGFYFYSGDSMKSESVTAVPNSNTVAGASDSVVKTPEKNSSTDEIVDYLVDGFSTDEKATSQASIDSSSVPSQAEAGSSLNTNF